MGMRIFIVSVRMGEIGVSSRQCFAGRADFGYRNDDAMKSKRYQAFTAGDQSKAVFTTRWRFLAEQYATWVCAWGGRDYFQIRKPEGVR